MNLWSTYPHSNYEGTYTKPRNLCKATNAEIPPPTVSLGSEMCQRTQNTQSQTNQVLVGVYKQGLGFGVEGYGCTM